MRALILLVWLAQLLCLVPGKRVGCRKMGVEERCKRVRRCRRVLPRLEEKCQKRKSSRPQLDEIRMNEVEEADTVAFAAEITSPPVNQTAPPGGEAQFTCITSGAPTPQTSIVTRRASSDDQRVEQRTSSSLSQIIVINIIRLVTESDEGWYRCSTQNAYGGETADAYLHVHDLCNQGNGAVCSDHQKICVGNYTSLTTSCQCRNYCQEQGDFTHSPVCGSDCQDYYSECRMRQEACRLGYPIKVLYRSKCPAFEELQAVIPGAPGPLRFFEDDMIELECLVGGTPHPNVIWYKSQTADQEELSLVSFGSTLRFSRALRDDTAFYTCVAQNCISNRLKSQAIEVVVQPRYQAARASYLAGSTCHVFGKAHVAAFDGFTYSFNAAACDYVLAMDCVQGSWLIYGKVVSCGGDSFCLEAVSFYTGRDVIVMARGWVVSHGSRKVRIRENREISAGYFKLLFDGLYLTASLRVGDTETRLIWDGISSAIIQVTGEEQHTCGLCGGNGGNPAFRIFSSLDASADFADSWRVDTMKRCAAAEERAAQCSDKDLPAAQAKCEEIFSLRLFRQCKGEVDHTFYLAACAQAVCGGAHPDNLFTEAEFSEECQVGAVYLKRCELEGEDVPRTLFKAPSCPSTRFIQPLVLAIGCPQNTEPYVN